jgi:acyl transferase domain-containing protein/acyl carrier protein/SAM-dependent methyltransferase
MELTPNAVSGWMIRELSARLGVTPAEIDLEERFSRYGLDSAQATGLIADLSAALGRPLPATLLWDHPTTARLVQFLCERTAAVVPTRSAATSQDAPIAVVGLACRFPQASNLEAYWRLLCQGVDAITEVPSDRWAINDLYDADPAAPGKMNTRWGGFLRDVDQFDPQFFGIAPREAVQMDPQQRLILELAWEALENAGIPAKGLRGSRTSVVIGAMWSDYARLLDGLATVSQHTATGQDTSIIAARVSYVLGLEGPSLTVNTACSSSLVAIHLACQSLRHGESTLALAGGVNLILSPTSTVAMTKFGAMSPDGHSKAFDAAANGYVRGEGAGLVALKPLARALADGDRIYCVIRGSAINNDGLSNGLTAPNPLAQEAVLREAYGRAGVAPTEVDYVETHGTGTVLGDPIEAKALGAVLGRHRPKERPLILGSVKTNIGHLEAAAGIAGFIKVALSIYYRTIPPSLHLEQPNPHIPFAELNLIVPRRLADWPVTGKPALAGVSSFGFGGTNSHVVMQACGLAPTRLLRISANTPEALRAQVRRMCAGGDGHAGAEAATDLPWRLALVVRSQQEGEARLARLLDGETPPGVFCSQARARKPVLVFSGNGSQWSGMGRQLLHDEPVFRHMLERCDRALRRLTSDVSILAALTADPVQARLGDVVVAQVLLFAVQVALAELWMAWGVEPAAVVGHSVGEVAAACVAGILELEQAMQVVWQRSCLQSRASGQGAMALVALAVEDTERALVGFENRLCIAGSNSPVSTVVSGDVAAVEALLARWRETGVPCQRIGVDVAYHSPWMEPLQAELVLALQGLRPRPGHLPMVSSVTAAVLPGMACEASYWGRNLRAPVRFAEAIECLVADGCDLFLEVSPHPILTRSVAECCDCWGVERNVLGSLRRHDDEREALLTTAAALYVRGLPVEPRSRPRYERPRHLLALSAKSTPALRDLAARYAEQRPASLADFCFTANACRDHFPYRLAITAPDWKDAHAALAAYGNGTRRAGTRDGRVERPHPPHVAFLFTGQGSQYVGMGQELYATQPTFREAIDRCNAVLEPLLGRSLPSLLCAPDAPLDQTAVTQPVLVALEYALAELWRSWGVEPAAVLGHSVGEYAAACCAGVLRLEEGLWLVAERGRLMQALPAGGAMAAVFADAARVTAAIAGYPDVAVAGVNGPHNTVISGAEPALQRILERLSHEQIGAQRLVVSHAFHSPLMDPMLDEFACLAAQVSYASPTLSFVSALEPELPCDAVYWRRHAREAVRFADGMRALQHMGCEVFLEIGPQPVLLGLGRTCLSGGVWLPSLRRGRASWEQLLESVAALYTGGVAVDWTGFDRDYPRRRLSLPSYPFQRQRFWLDGERGVPMPAHNGRATADLTERPWPGDLDPSAMPPLALVVERLTRRLPALRTANGLAQHAELNAQLNRLGALYAARALAALGWDGQSDTLAQVAVAPQHRRLLGRLTEIVQDNVTVTDSDLHTAIQASRAQLPNDCAEAGMLNRCGERLVELLRGTCDPLELLFPGGTLDDAWTFYRDAAFFRIGNLLLRDAVAALVEQVPDEQTIRILEIGAGTGGTTAYLLPVLPRDRTHYVFTDVSQVFLADARRVFADYPFLDVATLDIEADPASQAMAGRRFDLVVAVNVLHATANVRQTVDHVLQLLTSGGILALLEITVPTPWLDVVAGTIAGWWKFSDTDLRPAHPLLASQTWCELLRARGCAEVLPISDGGSQSLILARGPDSAGQMAYRGKQTGGAQRADVRPSHPSDMPPAVVQRPRPQRTQGVQRALGTAPSGASLQTRREALAAYLCRELAALLGFDSPEAVDPTLGFFAMGLDSLMAVGLRQRLATDLGRTITAATLFAYPNVNALADWLAAEPAVTSPPVTASVAGKVEEPIAVIGIGCRLPGGVADPDAFARLLYHGVDAVTEVPPQRWRVDDWYHPDPDTPGKMATRWGAFLSGEDLFDAAFFGISPREAVHMDPQQRLLLEVAWEALEHAGQAPHLLAGTHTGVFIGITNTDYAELARQAGDARQLNTYTLTGQPHNTAAGRISYFLGLQGPSMIVDTACSSSLVATHLACQALVAGECRMALAGGVNLMLIPESTVVLSRAHMMAVDGRCKTFDAAADGFVRGEGCGVIVLKRLSDALADNDRVLAVIRGSAVNHDGRSSGFTVPNGAAQEAVIRHALARAGVAPEQVGYVEAHGTGTALGDPIEVQALAAVYSQRQRTPLVIGAVKTNIGHLEPAAGIVGLIKTVVALQHTTIPPNLHFNTLNPHITLDGCAIELPLANTPWEPIDGQRIAGVSSFGASGTNAHVVVAEPPRLATTVAERERPVHVLCLSARDEVALKQLAERYARYLAHTDAALADICYSANVGRAHFPHRLALVAGSHDELCAQLTAFVAGSQTASAGRVETGRAPRLAFLFTGQGAQYVGMGRGLYDTQPRFRAVLDRCDALWRDMLGEPLLPLLFESMGGLDDPDQAPPALFALEYALAELWRAWGIAPSAVLGHGVGEYAAACVAGVFALEDGLRLVATRGHLKRAPLSEPMLDTFEPTAAALSYQEPTVPVISSITGGAQRTFNASYWRHHAEQPERLAEAVHHLKAHGCDLFVEIGPQPVLTPLGQQCIDGGAWVVSLRRGGDDWRTLLASLARVYTLGAAVDWRNFDSDYPRHKVPLPTYPFQRQRYWIEADAAKSSVPTPTALPMPVLPQPGGGGQEVLSGHPLLGRRVPSASTRESLFEAGLSTQAIPFLKEHCFRETVVLPATAYLEMALAATRAVCGSEPVEIAEVELLEVLAIPDAEVKTVQTIVTPQGDFELFSRAGDTWRQHAKGRWRVAPASAAPGGLDLDAVRRRCPAVVPHVYDRLAERGFGLGPSFRGLTHLWRSATEALGQIDTTCVQDGRSYHLHPALLDAGLQVLTSLLPPTATYLPVVLERYRLYGPLTSTTAWGHAVLRSTAGEACTGDVCLYSEAGSLVAAVWGLTMKRVTAAVRSPAVGDWFYDMVWRPLPAKLRVTAPGRWVLLTDQGGVGAALARLLTARGETCITDWFNEAELAAVQGIVDLRGLDQGTVAERCGHVLALVQRLRTIPTPLKLWLITRGADAVGAEAPTVDQAPLRGMGRVIALEHPELHCVRVDLDPAAQPQEQAAALLRHLDSADGEDQVAIRGGVGYMPRLVRSRARGEQPRQLVAREGGALDALYFEPAARRAPGPGEVEIRVRATGLNFKDVLNVLGHYPGDPGPLGLECTGDVVAVGDGVDGLALGDAVMAFGPGCFSGFATLDAHCTVQRPDGLSYEMAATLPVAFLTAWYGLHCLAGLRSGERVLIHAAAGGVGMAAVQLARRAGAEVLATASRSKWDVVRALGVERVMDSRSLDFARQVMEHTGGQGVDMVLNSLAGEFIPAGLSVLASGGRFLEIGKTDIWGQDRVARFRHDIAYYAYDMGEACAADPALFRTGLGEVLTGIAEGTLTPLPRHIFPLERAVEAFRTMAQARHTGKIVVVHESSVPVRPDQTYLITGGLGAIGLQIARWLVTQGAGHVVLVGRTPPSAAATQAVREMEALGTRVSVARVDVTRYADLEALLATLPPLRGVVHAAGVVDDGVLQELDQERFASVLAPKTDGAWNLHVLTRHMPLDFFVLLSSAAALLGAAGQASYAAANAFLDTLAHSRRAQGLPACAINWGPWGGQGMLTALSAHDRQRLTTRGFRPLTPAQGLAALEQVLRTGAIQHLVADVDWDVYVKAAEEAPPLLSELTTSRAAVAEHNILTTLRQAFPAQRRALLSDHVRQQTARVMGLAGTQRLEAHRPLHEIGLDSLMSVELRNALASSLHCPLPTTLLFDYPSIEALSAYLASIVLAEVEDAEALQTAPPEARTLEGLSEAELVSLLAEEVGMDSPRGEEA